jgi:HK97 family phage prohead protease
MAKKRFIFNDERVTNSYNFKIKTSGINLERFLKNPVMLADHWNDTSNVIGLWENTSVDGFTLGGDSLFDSEDEYAKNIEGKVDRGFIKGCSMGIFYNREDMEQQPDGSWVLLKCTLAEVSICAIPSNANSLRLYDASTQKLLTDDEIKANLSFMTNQPNPTPTMEKIELSVATLVALGLNTQPKNAQEIETHVEKLAGKLKDEQDAHAETKKQLSAIAEGPAKELVKQAKLSGKITESEVAEWEKMAKENYALASSALAKIPAKIDLSKGAKVPVGDGTEDDLPKNQDEFEKLSLDAQLAFKKEHPEAYKALWK